VQSAAFHGGVDELHGIAGANLVIGLRHVVEDLAEASH
jgi:hypothetical protein